MSKKGMIQMACGMLGGLGIGFSLGYVGWHLLIGELTLYEAGALMGYSILAAVGGYGVGCAIGTALNRFMKRRRENGVG